MNPASGSNEQMVAAAAAAQSGQRDKIMTAEDLTRLRVRLGKSVVKLEKILDDGTTYSHPGTIIASTPAYSYVLLHRHSAFDCEIVFPSDGARVKIKKSDFIINETFVALAKVSHGSSTPVQFTERPVSFVNNVFLYVIEGRGLTPGCVVNPTGESKPSGRFLINNTPDFAAPFGAPVFDEVGEFIGIVMACPSTCIVMGVSMIKATLREKVPEWVLRELTSLKVL